MSEEFLKQRNGELEREVSRLSTDYERLLKLYNRDAVPNNAATLMNFYKEALLRIDHTEADDYGTVHYRYINPSQALFVAADALESWRNRT